MMCKYGLSMADGNNSSHTLTSVQNTSGLLYLTPSLVMADDGNNVYPPPDRKSQKILGLAQGTTKAPLDHQGCLGSHKVGPVGFG